MINKRRLSIQLIVACALAAGCQPSTKSSTPNSTVAASASMPYTNAKLLVQKEPRGNTGVYHQRFVLKSPPLLKGNPADDERHSFEMSSMANFKGDKPNCVSKSTAITINHSTIRKQGWHYPPSATVAFVVDGKPFKAVRTNQLPLESEDGEFWESLIIQPSCDMFEKISKANALELKVGDASVPFSTDEMADYKRFTAAIGFK